MAVRRLYKDQPESFEFSAETQAFAAAAVKKFPPGRQASAVIPLLWQVQLQEGWVSEPAIRRVADFLGMPYIRVLEVATFYTMFQLQPVGAKAHIQVCGTTPCMLRGAEELIAICKSRIAPHAHELSADGAFSWEEVECLGACVNAPMVQVVKDTYEDLTPETFEALLDTFAAGGMPTPGPQNGRWYAAAEGGDTTLTDPDLYKGKPAAVEAPIAAEPEAPTLAEADAVVPEAATAGVSPATEEASHEHAGRPTGEGRADEEVVRAQPGDGDETEISGSEPISEERAISPVDDEHRPELLTAAPEGPADDLKLIWGVGPKLEAMLHEMGVYRFDQIAGWNDENIAWVDQRLGTFRGRASRDKWVEQARKLAGGWRPTDPDGDRPV
ncbi:NADH-quinone oxidoreductase subunit NuoE [Methylobrevis albus]|uniref:NADH-quinone oxidoreductase subunit NuoE n=1 Tax=Methylobrevis albus TaxID=2793297 RepID=A0A931I5W5_9HYPH|nr:NADH-quinone oxidoreductase subunit NuoE [Methylobrevis albus]MBH0239780.1 NADH-quinone oxidoreductase subunit NuoE [Methylobrevis albus]